MNTIYKELTLGSIVNHNGMMKIVHGITEDSVQLGDEMEAVNKHDITPIRIDGGFLLSNGFIKDESIARILGCESYKTTDGHICLRKISNHKGRSWNIHIDNESCSTIANADIEYLHQMQTELANQGIDFEINLKP